jgi:hypothetical protein
MVEVGVECQRRWLDDVSQRLTAEQRAYFDRSDYREAVSRYRQSGFKDSVALEDIEYSRREMAGMDPEDEADAPKGVHLEVPRPYQLQQKIISDVAAWASEKFGKQVSKGVVESAWAIARKVEAEDV